MRRAEEESDARTSGVEFLTNDGERLFVTQMNDSVFSWFRRIVVVFPKSAILVFNVDRLSRLDDQVCDGHTILAVDTVHVLQAGICGLLHRIRDLDTRLPDAVFSDSAFTLSVCSLSYPVVHKTHFTPIFNAYA